MSARAALKRTRVRLPVRVKLATVSAALTFVILLLFAAVVGTFTERRLRSGFDNDLRATAADLQERIRLRPTVDGETRLAVPEDILRAAAAGGATIRVVDRSGQLVAQTGGAPDLGPPVEGVRGVSGQRVVSRPLFAATLARPESGFNPFDTPPVDGVVGFVQYGKSERSVEGTLARVRLFLLLGVLGGTGLAFLAGLAVARRAMRPIAGLTQAARQVARTRDPDVALPRPEANDEVADLSDTLGEMLTELGAARAETESSLARQREFVADASHELRTPLTSILANLELLEAELQGEQAELAGAALRSSKRMRRLVADLLLLARADTGRQAPRRPVDLAEVAREAAAEAAPLSAEHPVSLDVPDGAVVRGAPDDLHRLALNLIENAVLHTPAGTPITVSVRREGEHAVLEVADRGPGIPAGVRPRVFERFARAGGDAAVAGSGLGLAIVRAVAEGHGGSVELTDAGGGGARFTVRLPLASDSAPVEQERPRAERPGARGGPTPPPPRAAPSAGA